MDKPTERVESEQKPFTLYEVEEETGPEIAEEMIRRDEKLLRALGQMHHQISQRILPRLEEEEENDPTDRLSLKVVESPQKRESLAVQNMLLKRSLEHLQEEIQSLRSKTDNGRMRWKASIRNLDLRGNSPMTSIQNLETRDDNLLRQIAQLQRQLQQQQQSQQQNIASAVSSQILKQAKLHLLLF